METLLQDLKFAVRSLRRTPAFPLVWRPGSDDAAAVRESAAVEHVALPGAVLVGDQVVRDVPRSRGAAHRADRP